MIIKTILVCITAAQEKAKPPILSRLIKLSKMVTKSLESNVPAIIPMINAPSPIIKFS